MHAMNRRIPTELVRVIIVLGLICVIVKEMCFSSGFKQQAKRFLKLSLKRVMLERAQSSLVKLAAKITASLGTGY